MDLKGIGLTDNTLDAIFFPNLHLSLVFQLTMPRKVTYKRHLPLVDATLTENSKDTTKSEGENVNHDVLESILKAARNCDQENRLKLSLLLAPAKPAGKDDPQHQPGPRSTRGLGYPLYFRLAVTDIYRFMHKLNKKVTVHNFYKYMDVNVGRGVIAQWDAEYDRIKFDVQHGRGSKCKLSEAVDDIVLDYVNKAVALWLKIMREEGLSVKGRQFGQTAKEVYHCLTESCSVEFHRWVFVFLCFIYDNTSWLHDRTC